MASSSYPEAGVEDAVQQLRAALEKDPAGFATDELTRNILEKLNAEVSRLYDEEGDEEDADAEGDELYDGDEEGAEDDDFGDVDGSPRPAPRSSSSESRRAPGEGVHVELPKGPTPYELWRSAHEVERTAKDKMMLTPREWNSLVERLNRSSRAKQMHVLQAQHKQMTDELTGLTFTPAISERSRELAAHNKALPERMAALMRKKKARLDKIRHEKACKELEEATFRPRVNDYKPSRAAQNARNVERKITHLMQYEMDRRVRADQRRSLMQELEDKQLTFSPAINANSIRIVERLNAERSSGSGGPNTADGSPSSPAGRGGLGPGAATAAASGAGGSASSQQHGGGGGSSTAPRPLGRSFLPGHEQETFHPRINPRSHALFRPGLDDKDVYSRLYIMAGVEKRRAVSASNTPSGASVAGRRVAAAAAAAAAGTAGRGAGEDADGEPTPGHPKYFNNVAFDSSSSGGAAKHDFLLNRLLHSPA